MSLARVRSRLAEMNLKRLSYPRVAKEARQMPRGRPLEVEQELLEAFVRNGRATEYLVSVLPVEIWRTAPASGRGRTIAGIVAHIQSVRRTFARLAGARPGPPSLDQRTVTFLQAQRALRRSTDDLSRLFAQAIASRRARVKPRPPAPSGAHNGGRRARCRP